MKCCNAYENNSMCEMMGETLRPGGFSLTERGVQFCKFSVEDAVLDLGCGWGATVGYLFEKHHIKAVGIDPSEKLLGIAKMKYPFADFIQGSGEHMPFADECFQGVFAECTLSLMDDVNRTVKEVFRVLKRGGWFIATDVYARNPDAVKELEKFSFKSCMRGLHDLNRLRESLESMGFEIMVLEDCSDLLKALLVKIVFLHGSMGGFWNKTTDGCIDGYRFQKILKVCKPGYFTMMARKGESKS
ncbi:DVU_1556 family methyltransferase [Geosporobacter ferrireducens]|uniref:DVU_1556 family methyltransferase n=1 Tax=Geosporobacter ferrireducens TaxID=1424294 RepID=UPI00139B7F91|nr:class I SAM-dependent methyltransferase [Geosporobacter ferrireducens]MTI57773.1 class I SAM-dependent methyltransferase [Geosporobacter ferrireducens]